MTSLLWERHLVRKYLFIFASLFFSVYFVYIATDVLFKFKSFEGNLPLLVTYYLCRFIPFFLISMPVVGFIAQILMMLSLHKHREWHIVRISCFSKWRMSRALIALGLCMSLIWFGGRELLLPLMQSSIETSYRALGKNRGNKMEVISSERFSMFVTPLDETHERIRVGGLTWGDGGEVKVFQKSQAIWDANKWHLPEASEDPRISEFLSAIPSPKILKSQRENYVYLNAFELWGLYSDFYFKSFLDILLAERFLYPLLFFLFFSLSAYHLFRCRQDKSIWIIPSISLFIFSSLFMTFKGLSVELGLSGSLSLVGGVYMLTQTGLSFYFSRGLAFLWAGPKNVNGG